MISVRLNASIEKRLTDLAKKTKRTKASYVREAILEYLENIEDILVATHRLNHPSKMCSFEELKTGLWPFL